MLQLFSEALNWSFYGILLIRIALGLWFLASGTSYLAKKQFWTGKRVKKTRYTDGAGTLDMIAGILLLTGFALQGAAALAAVLSAVRLYRYHSNTSHLFLFLILTLVSIALITLGPGPLSLDLPL